MAENFKYDVFLSHSSKDKEVVRAVAEQLRADGLRVWPGVFEDEWELKQLKNNLICLTMALNPNLKRQRREIR